MAGTYDAAGLTYDWPGTYDNQTGAVPGITAPGPGTLFVVLVRLAFAGGATWSWSDSAYFDSTTGQCYSPRLTGEISYSRGVSCILWGSEDADNGLGAFELINDDGALDALVTGSQAKGTVTVALVEQGHGTADETVFATADFARAEARGERTVRIVTQSILERLKKPFQPVLYSASDTFAAPPGLIGLPRPFALGLPLSCPVLLVNEVDYEYDVHEGGGWTVAVVRDSGYVLVDGVGYNTSVTAGINGIELLALPVGRIVADVVVDGPIVLADALEALVDRAVAQGIDVEIHAASLTALGTACPYAVSYWSASATTHYEALQAHLNSVVGWVFPDTTGQLRVGRLQVPTGDPVLEITEIVIAGDIEIDPDFAPGYSATVAGARNWYVHQPAELVDDVTDADRGLLTTDYRVRRTAAAPVSDELTDRGGGALAGAPLPTLLDDAADVQAVADHIAALYPVDACVRFLKIPVFLLSPAAVLLPGQKVVLRYPRYGCDNGREFVVKRVAGRVGDPAVDVYVWGEIGGVL